MSKTINLDELTDLEIAIMRRLAESEGDDTIEDHDRESAVQLVRGCGAPGRVFAWARARLNRLAELDFVEEAGTSGTGAPTYRITPRGMDALRAAKEI